MPLKVELVGTGKRWTLSQPRIRIGAAAGCEVVLAEGPGVAAEHAALRIEGRDITFTSRVPGGLLHNGQVATQGRVRTGDVLRFGQDGPELRFEWIEPAKSMREQMLELQAKASKQQDVTTQRDVVPGAPRMRTTEALDGDGVPIIVPQEEPLARRVPVAPGDEPTLREYVPDADATLQHPVADSPTLQHPSAEESRVADAATVQAPAQRRADIKVHVGVARHHEAAAAEVAPVTRAAAATDTGLAPEEEAMIEQKLNAIRNLLAFNLIAVLLLLGIIFMQAQQLKTTRDAVTDLNVRAQGAVAQLMPSLDARLGKFEQRVDAVQAQINGADGRMKAAEDHFVQRMDKEMPAMMDKYLAKKMDEAQRKGVVLPR